MVSIAANDLMTKAEPYFVKDGYSFVAYGIPEAETVVRGSLRYDGNPALIHALATLGWLETTTHLELRPGATWAQHQQRLTGAKDTSER